ncbi:major facilitator superfamily domain-containing protein [Xylariaceae sp. AK1471]|nr:major facilitator superfamily domain-containing protein [Xylariaceae sp. AK1471]
MDSTSTARQEVIQFDIGDVDNPVNWSTCRKTFIAMIGVLCTFNSVFNTSLPSGYIDVLSAHFNIQNSMLEVLPITVYQIGFLSGSLLFAPLSETYGRKMVVIGSSGFFCIFILGSVFSPSWSAYLGFRFLQGACASSAISVTGGLNADIFDDVRKRGRANAIFLCILSVVPNLAPLIAAYASLPPLNWMWPLWISLILSVATFIPTLFLPETYGPIILQRRAVQLRKQHGPGCAIYAAIELEQRTWKDTMTVFLARPIRMLCREWIVLFTSLFLGFATGIYYLFFRSYAIIFMGEYGLGQGPSRLALLPVALGSLLGLPLTFLYDHFLYRARALGKPWSMNEEYRRLPLACVGGPLCVAGLFWLGWTASPPYALWIPASSGIIFGLGFYFILAALNNYLADAYQIYSASALAAVSFSRSVWGGTLILAADSLYKSLHIRWATSLLGFIMLVLSVVPFVFIRYGPTIRSHSKFCQELAKDNNSPNVNHTL